MITVTCKDADSKTEEKNIYPCLKISVTHNRVILFTAPQKGFVVSEGPCHRFEPYPGTIELKNG